MAERLSEACRPRVFTQPGSEANTFSRRRRPHFKAGLALETIAVGAWMNSTGIRVRGLQQRMEGSGKAACGRIADDIDWIGMRPG